MADDPNTQQLVARHPKIGLTLGWFSLVALLAGYLASFLGHVDQIKIHIFRIFGLQSLVSIHYGMLIAVFVLLTAGYLGGMFWIYRKYMHRQLPMKTKALGIFLLAIGFVVLTALSVYAAIPPSPDIRPLLSEEAKKWRQDLLELKNKDGGARWSKVDRSVESQVWSTAQVLVGLLSNRKNPLDEATGAHLRSHFEYIHKAMLNDNLEGWGYFEYVPWGVSEINAWVCVALALSMHSEHKAAIWGKDSAEADARLAKYIKLVTTRQLANGGWAPIADSSNPRFARTYSTVMSLWALLEVRRLNSSHEHDEAIAGGLDWLLQEFNPERAGWVPNPDRRMQFETFPGLTAQAIYVLTMAEKDFPHKLTDSNYGVALNMLENWLRGQEIPRQHSSLLTRPVTQNDRTHDADRYLSRSRYTVEGSTFLWYPWVVASCSILEQTARNDSSGARWSGCAKLRNRASEWAKFVRESDITYITAESLFAAETFLSAP